ncbi:hypothetical protein V1389_14785 [Flavobacterium rakeshii]|uniref:hypothetical protein n=1 Tax=Flavobacterium rakeshii TaxID=1038845 RepID=UPI002E7B729A|nr:hypothetical protein [Flavobacterium rakeshii]MEE1899612.1 hypothetical protein [Flavobacterium rakeshii]
MKKLFCFLAIAATAAFTSCSSDDDSGNNDNGGGDVVTGITLTSSSSTVTLGSPFTFTVKNNLNEDVTAASTIYVDDTALEGNTYTATEAGTYTVHATNGDFTSADVTVTVTEETIVITSLEVDYDVQVVNINETITFTATANGNMDVTADAVFYVNGTEIEGNTFSSDAVGVYQITASYEGYTTDDSEDSTEAAVVAFMDAVTFTETDVNNSALVYFGRVPLNNGGLADYFSIISYEGTDALTDVQTDNYLDVEVLVLVEEGDDVTFPSADNANFYQIYEIVKGGVNYPILSIESGSVTEATGLVADSETATFNIQSAFNGSTTASTINLNYNGAFDNYYDQSEQAGEGRGVTLTLENIRASRTKKFSSK